ncbi:MAG TPA: HAD family phosphatase [Candidatus Paceibacterota bacterium]|nr:HAD family phosphatase [Candidatus Paceibacterota bacterium]
MRTSKSSRNKPHVIAVVKNNYLDISPRVFNMVAGRRGVIFDLDGTLVDMEQANYRLYFEFLKRMYGLEITEREWKKFFAGRRPQESIPDFLKSKEKEQTIFDFEKFKLLAGPIKDELISKHLGEVSFLIPGINQFLNRLKKLRNMKLALATSTIDCFVKQILKYFNTDNYFDIVLTGENVSKGKPNPEIYLKTLKALKLKSDDCLVFEDSQSGVEAALGAEIDVIKIQSFWVRRSGHHFSTYW